ncbi:hypothetical protein TPENAI_30020 [Tenacibaculum litopenaei]|uniref:hypothetical protein n=1 Tax=Tenacibaculum litopenaei TaxID=396016 RepID=UPI003894D831
MDLVKHKNRLNTFIHTFDVNLFLPALLTKFGNIFKLFDKSDDVVKITAKLSDEAIQTLKVEKGRLEKVLKEVQIQLQNGNDQIVREISRGHTPNPHGLAKEVNETLPRQIEWIHNRLNEINQLIK